MTNPCFTEELKFDAQYVEAYEEKYTDDFVVHGIYFSENENEAGGQHWNFTRALGDDDDGVCTVKEIQAATVYEGIANFDMRRTSIVCEFDSETAKRTGIRHLTICYQIDDANWSELLAQAERVFAGKAYFKLTPA